MTLNGSLPVWMWPLLLVGAAGAVFYVLRTYGQTRPAARPPWRSILTGLRIAAVLLLFIGLVGPVLIRSDDRSTPAVLAVIVEDSASMRLADAGSPADEEGSVTRWAAALEWVAALDSLADALPEKPDVALYRGNGLSPLRQFDLNDPVVMPPSSHGTDLAALVRQAGDQTAGRGVRAMVLLSDGRETKRRSGTNPANLPRTPVNVVEVGDPSGPADRFITDLRYPATIYGGDEAVLEFAVDHRFAAGVDTGSIRVTLSGPDGFETSTVLAGRGMYRSGQIGFTPQGVGLQVFELEIESLDNERFLANNRVSLALDVRKERARVLVVAGRPGWDVRFMAQAALKEERLDLAVVYPGPDGLVFADSLVPWGAEPGQDRWSGWDGIVLAGWSDLIPNDAWLGLAAAIRAGAGLLVIPGPSSPNTDRTVVAPSEVAGLLPVDIESWHPDIGAYFLKFVPGSGDHPLVDGVVGVGGDHAAATTGKLPPLRHLVRSTARPGTETLAVAGPRGNDSAGNRPVLVAGSHEQGRVVWFGGRALWELGFWDLAGDGAADTDPDHPGRRLVRNLLVWVASGGEDSGLVLTGRQPFFQEGERLELEARWRDLRGQPVVDRRVSLEVRPAGADSTRARSYAMRPDPDVPGTFRVELPPHSPGHYGIRLHGEGDPEVRGDEQVLAVTAHSVENTQVRSDRRRLAGLAASGGGEFYSAREPGARTTLTDRLAQLDWTRESSVLRRRFDFRSSWLFVGLSVVLLGIEWFIRRRQGQL